MTTQHISKERAISVAADTVQMSGLPAVAHLVQRLDGQHPYFLVHFGHPGGRGAAAMVDAVDESVMAHATVERIEETWLINEERAIEIADCPQPIEAHLVWKASRATRSPFYPLWQLSTTSGTLWVDQSGKVWRDLTSPGPG